MFEQKKIARNLLKYITFSALSQKFVGVKKKKKITQTFNKNIHFVPGIYHHLLLFYAASLMRLCEITRFISKSHGF